MLTKTVSTGYKPRPIQDKLHRILKRFNVLVCHRRFGKTVFAINHMIDSGLRNTLVNPQYAYIAPLYAQAKRVAWDYLKMYTANIPGSVVNEADLRVDIPRPDKKDRIRFMLLGADNPQSLRGIYLDGGILDEVAEMHPSTWSEVIRPALSDRLGWAVFIGTPKGRNHFYDLYRRASNDEKWLTAVYKASETGIIDNEELAAAKKEMDPDVFEQEFVCSFNAGVIGAYYNKLMQEAENSKRITSVPYDPSVPVSTFWDLGIGDSCAIWFMQSVGKELHWIDYVEESGLSMVDYGKIINNKGYLYEEHVLPHDAKARELGTGKTREEYVRAFKLGRVRVLARQSVDDGIQAVRSIIPRSWFDEVKTKKGIEALKNYQRKWDAKAGVFIQHPLHNWASHGADAFRAGAMGLKEIDRMDASRLPRQAEIEYDLFDL